MVRPEDATPRKFFTDETNYRITLDFFGRSSRRGGGEEAFAIELENRALGAHFHPVDQFQLLLGGAGSLYQRHAIPPLMLHYADAYTTYGPIFGGAPALQLFTLRAEATDETAYMPADRDQLRYRGRRNLSVEPATQGTRPTKATAVTTTSLFAAGEDGFGASKITAAPAAAFEAPSAAGCSGQYLVVAEGAVEFGDSAYGRCSLGWMDPDDDAVELRAGATGCDLLVCRFPSPPTRVVRLGAVAASAG
jgi:hypothetical protein